jgi:hypothetical protein
VSTPHEYRSVAEIEEAVHFARQMRATVARQGMAHFLGQIVIPASPDPLLFAECADDWQRESLADMVPAYDHLAGLNPEYDGPLNFMKILARGHNKSSEQAWMSCGLLTNSKRRIEGYVLAADRDQGRLIIRAARDFLACNEWVPVEVQKDVLVGPAGHVEVLPFDAKSGMGLRGNFFIFDEIVHWKRQDEWNAIVSGLSKIKPCLVSVMSNAGLLDSWQHDVFLRWQADPKNYVVFHREGTLAKWLDPKALARDRLLLPPSEAERLIDNKWIDPASEFDYLRRAEVDECARLGASLDLMDRVRREVGVDNYVAAIDYGPRRDRTVLVVVHMNRQKQIIVDRMDVWQGNPGAPVQVQAVEDWVRKMNAAFGPRMFVLDPYQMEGTIQWMQRSGIPVEAFAARNGQANYQMAQTLRALIVDKRLLWAPRCGLLRVEDRRTGQVREETFADELVGLRVKPMPYGFRFDHEVQKHDDRAVAVGMALSRALEYPATTSPVAGLVRKIERPVTDGGSGVRL